MGSLTSLCERFLGIVLQAQLCIALWRRYIELQRVELPGSRCDNDMPNHALRPTLPRFCFRNVTFLCVTVFFDSAEIVIIYHSSQQLSHFHFTNGHPYIAFAKITNLFKW